MKQNSAYWDGRAIANESYFQELSDDRLRELAKYHDEAYAAIQRELEALTRNIAKKGDGANYLYRKQQIEELKQSIDNAFVRVAGQDVRLMQKFFGDVVAESVSRSAFDIQRMAGVGFAVRRPNKQLLDSVINSEWAGRNFKDSVGWNCTDAAMQAKEIIAKAALTGVNIHKMSQELSNLQGVDLWKAERLVRTETNYFAGQGEKLAYDRCGIEHYRYLATLDKVTSETCRDLDGKVFDVKDARAGKNYPPMHPWCRSTTVAHFDDEALDGMERRARNPKTGEVEIVEPGMTYKTWKGKYVDIPAQTMYNSFRNAIHERIGKEYQISLNTAHQDKHIAGAENFDPMRSTLTADPAALLDLYAGEGDPIQTRAGEWNQRERFTHTSEIGVWRSIDGEELPTNKGIIHYTKRRGAHIVPADPRERRRSK